MDLVDFELRKKLQDALSSGRFMLTISYVNNKEIKHYSATKNFPREDILPSFEKLIECMAYEIPLWKSSLGETDD